MKQPVCMLATLAEGPSGSPLALGCGSAPAPALHAARELIMAYDDARATGTVAFPTPTYESVVPLPAPRRRAPARCGCGFRPRPPGSWRSPSTTARVLETPGDADPQLTRDLADGGLSDGKDGRWVVEDLVDLKPLKGVVWVGVHKVGGDADASGPAASSRGRRSCATTIRSNPMGLLPTKRTPMLRLELAP